MISNFNMFPDSSLNPNRSPTNTNIVTNNPSPTSNFPVIDRLMQQWQNAQTASARNSLRRQITRQNNYSTWLAQGNILPDEMQKDF